MLSPCLLRELPGVREPVHATVDHDHESPRLPVAPQFIHHPAEVRVILVLLDGFGLTNDADGHPDTVTIQEDRSCGQLRVRGPNSAAGARAARSSTQYEDPEENACG